MKASLWRCKDGSVVAIKDMTDSHLANTIKMLRRGVRRQNQANLSAAYSVSFGLQGEMAQLFVEQDIDCMEEFDEDEWLSGNVPQYDKMMREAEKRGLDV